MTIISADGAMSAIRQINLPTAGEAVAQLTSNKDAATQANENKILAKYANIVTGIQAQTQALKDSYVCSLTNEQLSEVQPVLEKQGYAISLGKSNASTGRTTVTISWTTTADATTLTGVNPTSLELCLDYAYATVFFPQGGSQPYTFTLKEGVLPQGLSLTTTTTTATLTGTPTLTGVDYFKLETVDAKGVKATSTINWIVKAVGGTSTSLIDVSAIKLATKTVVGTTSTNDLVLSATLQTSDANVTINDTTLALTGKLTVVSTVPPTSSIGQLGDKIGRVAIDSNYIYYCIATYVTVTPPTLQPNIWKRVSLTGGTWS